MLGVTHDDLKFQCFSKDLGYEKPNPLIFAGAMERAQPFLGSDEPMDPAYALHIGNDFNKDFEGARAFGEHAVLLDRYDEHELAGEWRRRGAPVFKDLLDIVEFLGRSNCQLG
jgi:putative hydrolase of the HAD superfamily